MVVVMMMMIAVRRRCDCEPFETCPPAPNERRRGGQPGFRGGGGGNSLQEQQVQERGKCAVPYFPPTQPINNLIRWGRGEGGGGGRRVSAFKYDNIPWRGGSIPEAPVPWVRARKGQLTPFDYPRTGLSSASYRHYLLTAPALDKPTLACSVFFIDKRMYITIRRAVCTRRTFLTRSTGGCSSSAGKWT
jgi:hypothetical protein